MIISYLINIYFLYYNDTLTCNVLFASQITHVTLPMLFKQTEKFQQFAQAVRKYGQAM